MLWLQNLLCFFFVFALLAVDVWRKWSKTFSRHISCDKIIASSFFARAREMMTWNILPMSLFTLALFLLLMNNINNVTRYRKRLRFGFLLPFFFRACVCALFFLSFSHLLLFSCLFCSDEIGVIYLNNIMWIEYAILDEEMCINLIFWPCQNVEGSLYIKHLSNAFRIEINAIQIEYD